MPFGTDDFGEEEMQEDIVMTFNFDNLPLDIENKAITALYILENGDDNIFLSLFEGGTFLSFSNGDSFSEVLQNFVSVINGMDEDDESIGYSLIIIIVSTLILIGTRRSRQNNNINPMQF